MIGLQLTHISSGSDNATHSQAEININLANAVTESVGATVADNEFTTPVLGGIATIKNPTDDSDLLSIGETYELSVNITTTATSVVLKQGGAALGLINGRVRFVASAVSLVLMVVGVGVTTITGLLKFKRN